jgi:RNA polymerase I-specific transcription initiation factor RRN3
VISLAPGGQSQLAAVLEDFFPYKLQSRAVLVEYVSQLLVICEYLPHHQPKILDLIVKRCVEIDVDIIIEESGATQLMSDEQTQQQLALMDGAASELEDQRGAGIFSFEDEDAAAAIAERVPSPSPPALSSAAEGGPRISGDAAVAAMADRLDGMLEALLASVGRQLDCSGDAAKDKLFLQLLAVFEYRALPTHKSKFVQFVMFYVCSRDGKYADAFARRLLELFLDAETAESRRQSAVMYLASFLCRLANQQASLVR